jgi:hypothetical protein
MPSKKDWGRESLQPIKSGVVLRPRTINKVGVESTLGIVDILGWRP